MQLEKLTIHNFRCFKDLEISFGKLTTLVGENGAGKTAILEAINFAFGPSFLSSRIDEQDFNNADAGNIEIILTFDKPFNVKLADGYTTRDVPCKTINLEVHRRERASPGKALSDGFVARRWFEPTPNIKRTKDKDGNYLGWEMPRKGETTFKFNERTLEQPREIEGLPRCFYFNKERENQAKIGYNSTLQKLVDEFNWRFRKGLDGRSADFLKMWNELYDHVLGSVGKKKMAETFEPIRNKLKSIAGSKYDKLDLSLLNLEQPFGKSFFSLREDLNQTELGGLGSGISMILSYFLLETVSELSKETLIVLIDEPELHLHPQLRRKFRKRLEDSSSQIILSTHSEDMVDLGSWRSVKRIDIQQQWFPLPSVIKEPLAGSTVEGHLDDLSKFYQDKLSLLRENNEMFFARKCVLVEGATDKYCIEILAAKGGINIEDFTIINCNGKGKIKFYQLICRAFGIPYFTLFDFDGKDEEDKENKAIIAGSSDAEYFAFSNDLSAIFGIGQEQHRGSRTMEKIEECTTVPVEVIAAFEKIKSFVLK